jgi:hypothetical protein
VWRGYRRLSDLISIPLEAGIVVPAITIHSRIYAAVEGAIWIPSARLLALGASWISRIGEMVLVDRDWRGRQSMKKLPPFQLAKPSWTFGLKYAFNLLQTTRLRLGHDMVLILLDIDTRFKAYLAISHEPKAHDKPWSLYWRIAATTLCTVPRLGSQPCATWPCHLCLVPALSSLKRCL